MSQPLIELRAVTRQFAGPPVVEALREVNLYVASGDYLAVTGPSGSGKSTLLNVIGLLDRPSTGQYLFDGVDLTDLGEDARTALRGHRIGFVFQDFHLLPYRTALENVALAQLYLTVGRRQRLRTAHEMLHRVGLGSRAAALPTTLSGGERQRVAIARALASAPTLLLCDEPTGNLDSDSAGQVLALLDGLSVEGVTILVITHDRDTANRARREIRIRDGRLTEIVR
jgi:putative ABC transport system ATP-binding protein